MGCCVGPCDVGPKVIGPGLVPVKIAHFPVGSVAESYITWKVNSNADGCADHLLLRIYHWPS